MCLVLAVRKLGIMVDGRGPVLFFDCYVQIFIKATSNFEKRLLKPEISNYNISLQMFSLF